ncbi:hypothetical protein AX16_007088 [Volvariella volvacea WC 439]|nr:hypothetical protein AX16_007088 [Volvariella volvacea WC 439]
MDLLEHCKNSLEVLGLNIVVPLNRASFGGFTLSNLSQLRQLRLRASFCVKPDPPSPPGTLSFADFISAIYTQMPPQFFELFYFDLVLLGDTTSPPEAVFDSVEPGMLTELDQTLAILIKHMPGGGEAQIILKED